MKCNKCEAIFPSHYSHCPHCESKDFEREKFKIMDKEVEIVEEVSPYAVNGDIDDISGNL